MKKVFKIIVPILLAFAVIGSIGWYLIKYDPGFTRDVLLSQARSAEERGDHGVATWLYGLAYKQSGEDETVAIELAKQYKSVGNYTKAEYTLSNAIADGGTVELYIALCQTYVEQDKLLDAVTMLDNVADPNIKAQLEAIRPQVPAATPEHGYYNQYVTVTLSAPEGHIYISTNAEYPSIKSEPYSAPIPLPGGETTIYALTVGDNGLVSSLGILGYTVAGVIEEVTITDPALEQLVRQKLQITEDHSLYSDELWSITELEIPAETKVLSDLPLMPFLERLIIRDGQFDSLSSLSALSNLKELTIEGTALSGEDIKAIASLPNLTTLTLARCRFTSLAELAAATNLTYLDLNNNTIRDLTALSNMRSLEYLNLSNNAVTSLDALGGLNNLKELYLSYNSITSTAPLAGCTALSVLKIDHNSLTALEGLEKLAGLGTLSAEYNQLAAVGNLASNTELVNLDISNNTLADIAPLSTLNKLVDFDFSYNQVTKLPTFSTECDLVTINGAHNQLSSLEELKGMQKLNYVLMDYNAGITSIKPLTSCYHLVEVNVYGTGVTDASALTQMNVIVKYSPIGSA